MKRHRRRHWMILAVGLALCSGLARAARAEEPPPFLCPICRHASDQQADYPTKAGYTLMRGAANTLLGWTEMIEQPVHEVKQGGNVFVGIVKGLGRGVTRTVGGMAELLTFWTPKVQDEYVHFAENCPICMRDLRKPPAP